MKPMRPSGLSYRAHFLALAGLTIAATLSAATTTLADNASPLLTGPAAMGDWTQDAPGVRRKIMIEDLPALHATESARKMSKHVDRPNGTWPKVPAGFKVELYAEGFKQPRKLAVAPNGDLFVVDSEAKEVRVLRDIDGDGKPDLNQVFVSGLDRPFGLAFYPPGPNPRYVYIGNTGSVVRVPYSNGDLKASAQPETVVAHLSSGGQLTGGGHWTRDLVFSQDAKKLFVSIGSKSNSNDDEVEAERARIFEFNPDGSGQRVYASGIRNPVGIAIDPATGALWTSVNERDGLGDNLPPDYITRVKDGGFYGWPWFYLGTHEDPTHAGQHPELKAKVVVPDVLLQAHSASLCLTFYDQGAFPAHYRGQIFAAEHGSWNREKRTGYKVIVVPVKAGSASGEYEDFMTGFVTSEGDVWGRPVGVATGKDGALFVSDDGGKVIWRVTYAQSATK